MRYERYHDNYGMSALLQCVAMEISQNIGCLYVLTWLKTLLATSDGREKEMVIFGVILVLSCNNLRII